MATFVVGKSDPSPDEPVRVWLEVAGGSLLLWAQVGCLREVVLEIKKGGRINRHSVDSRIAAAAAWVTEKDGMLPHYTG